MADENTVALREIGDLLRQRVEQAGDMAKRAEERFARIPDARAFTAPDLSAIEAKHDREAEAHREEAARRRAEDVEFRERLLAAIERQSLILERLLDRITPPSSSDHDRPL